MESIAWSTKIFEANIFVIYKALLKITKILSQKFGAIQHIFMNIIDHRFKNQCSCYMYDILKVCLTKQVKLAVYNQINQPW